MSESAATSRPLTPIQQGWLKGGFRKIASLRAGQGEVHLHAHEAKALYREFCRLANFATLLGEPSPAEMAAIFTTEECAAMVADEYGGAES